MLLRKTVLIAEDNDTVGCILRECCEASGLETHLVANGLRAVDALRFRRFDVVLTDLHMPLMNGNALTRHIAKSHPGLPVIIVTAHPEAVERDVRDLARAVLSKPLVLHELPGILQTVVGAGGRAGDGE